MRQYTKNIKFKDIGYTDYYSHPILFKFRKYFISSRAKKMCYEPLIYLNKNHIFPDFILIDGRYRVLCALYLYKFLKNKKKSFRLIIDDYRDRITYHILSKFYKIKIIGRFGYSENLIIVNKREIDFYIKFFSLHSR